MVWDLAPNNEEVQEFVCEDNNKDAVHLLGKYALGFPDNIER